MSEDICIDKSIIGTEKHLLRTGGSYVWTSSPPSNAWHLSGSLKEHCLCLDTLARLACVKLFTVPNDRYLKPMVSLLSGSAYQSTPPWHKIMPPSAHREFIKTLLTQVDGLLQTSVPEYFKKVWVPGTALLGALQRAKIDFEAWKKIDEQDGSRRIVSSFEPRGDYADVVKYDRLSTVTGRLVVSSGPKILLLNKEYRKMIVPSTKNGKIIMLDFAALEARVLLYEAGRRCDERDMYRFIADELGVARDAVKAAVLIELYGGSMHTLQVKLGISGKELRAFTSKVQNYFNVEPLKDRLKSQFFSGGRITNRYGRIVNVDTASQNSLVNYYAQSTGVDITLMGFHNLVSAMQTAAPGVRPLYLIHDAIILDVPEEHLEYVNSITSVQVPGYVQKFLIRSEEI